MGQRSDDFGKKLLATFRLEASEHAQALSSRLIGLEKAATPAQARELIESLFREAHSLKGAARAVNVAEIETLCQSLESVFSALKRGAIALSPALLDLLHEAVDTFARLLPSIGRDRTAAETARLGELAGRLENAPAGTLLSPGQEEAAGAPGPGFPQPGGFAPPDPTPLLFGDTMRVSTATLEGLFLQIQELLSVRLAAGQRAAELREANSALTAWNRQRGKLQSEAKALLRALERESQRSGNGAGNGRMQKLLEALERDGAQVQSFENRLLLLARLAEQDARSLGRRVDQLVDDMKKALMLPFSSLWEIFPPFVRDLARKQAKDVELVLRGGELEMDRRILQEMKDPLIHLVRNCIDHGIEKPEERRRRNKPPRGTVQVAIAQKNGHKVEMVIGDDGAGIDLSSIRAAAVRLGVVSDEEAGAFDDKKTLPLIFESGVSTSPILTDISGRGLGLAIVREKVEALGGTIAVESRPNFGTTIRIVLPLSLSTVRGILVRADDCFVVVPTTSITRLVRVRPQEIATVENRETIQVDGEALALARLADVLGLPRKKAGSQSAVGGPAVIVASADKRMAFLVDDVLAEQEILVKSLGPQLSRVRNIAAATVLGTGKVVPILNVPDAIRSAIKASGASSTPAAAVEEAGAKKQTILVVEDSLTARTLLKNVLEAAGYSVKTAVDGADAFASLKTEPFDLVVSDVDMPRMNGFDLTAKIRADKALSELPVVLVTALESREDRERGVDVGANAYLVKSGFDQGNLLEIIRRLI